MAQAAMDYFAQYAFNRTIEELKCEFERLKEFGVKLLIAP